MAWVLTPELTAAAQALRDARRADSPGESELADRIASSGPAAVEAALEILVRARVPEVTVDDAPQILSQPQRDVLLLALSRIPEADVRSALELRLAAATEGDHSVDLAAVHALGAVGGARDLQRVAALAPRTPTDPPALTREARTAVRGACAAILRRDPRAWGELPDVIRTSDEICARALLEALSTGQEPRALPVLAEAARVHAALAPQAVMLAVRCGPSTDLALDAEFTAWMLSELPQARHEYSRGLLQAIGALDDGDAVAILIDRLDHEDAGLRDAALGALRRMTGLGLATAPDVWRAWYAKELRWQERERPRLRNDLQASDPGRVTAALREYRGRRVWRGSLSQDVIRVLERREAGLRRLACDVLAQLGSPSALKALSSALQDADASVAEAAWRAMRTLSGMDLPHEPERVREILRLD